MNLGVFRGRCFVAPSLLVPLGALAAGCSSDDSVGFQATDAGTPSADASFDAPSVPAAEAGTETGADVTTCAAQCQGQVLTTCDAQQKPVTQDCSAMKDASGKAMTCAFLKDQGHYDCIGDYNGGCGDETLAGRCSGTTFIECASVETGKVLTVDCSKDPGGLTSCAVASDGTAGCAAPGTTGCGNVTADGTCTGNSLSKCVASSVVTTNCAAGSQVCGLATNGSPTTAWTPPSSGRRGLRPPTRSPAP